MTETRTAHRATAKICVVMTVFRPDPAQFDAQMQSIAAQDFPAARLILVVADCTSEALVREVAADHRLPAEVLVPPAPLDAVRAFEHGLRHACKVTSAGWLIALADQDDIWHPDRLKRSAANFHDPAVMATHADARLIDAQGRTLAPSMFHTERRHRRPGLRGLLYRNNLTGMTSTFRREVIELALPFPQQAGVFFYHDLWLALVASALGEVRLIEAPLVDYRQHSGNAVGAIMRKQRTGKRLGFRGILPGRAALRREAATYGLARYLAKSLSARTAETPAADVTALRPYLRHHGTGLTHMYDALGLLFAGHPGLARIAAWQGAVAAGRLAWAFRHALSRGLPAALEQFDERLYSLAPGVSPYTRAPRPQPPAAPRNAQCYIDARKRPSWTPELGAGEPALNLLVPTLNPSEVFAGIATAVDIGIGLAARGHRVRLIACDLPIASAEATRNFIHGRITRGNGATAARLSQHCGVVGDGGGGPRIPAHRADLHFATAWWTTHVARDLISRHALDRRRMIYLVQDHEPNFYPWGSEYADAEASYHFDTLKVFNTSILRDFFVDRGLARHDDLAFRPAIDLARYCSGSRTPPGNGPRRLALYGRPEVDRNLFPTAIEALARFIDAAGLGPADIAPVSVGLRHEPIELPRGIRLESLGKLPWERYPEYLLGVDVGLSLMYSPHPSHPPLEMAASGVRVVTNNFGAKDLSRLSGAIQSVAPTPEALSGSLRRAWEAGPVPDEMRQVDLGQLGPGMDQMIDRLSQELITMGLPREGQA